MNRALKFGSLAMGVLALMAAGNKPQEAAAGRLAEAAPAGTATISGDVSFTGSAPAGEKIKMAADPACLQQHSTPMAAQDLIVNGGKLQYALVYVKEGVSGTFPAPAETVTLNQTGCLYDPHVLGIQVGQKLEIVNNDSTLHNINCQAKSNKKFNIAQPAKGMKSVKTFEQAEVAVPFKCNVHPWMVAYAGVFSHPFFAVSGANGSFSIKGLPAGTYTVEAWHEKLGTQSQGVTVADGESKQVSFSFAGK